MNQINLEAEQVVSEEGEEAPKGRRGLLAGKKTMIVFGVVLVLEAVVLLGVFEAMRGSSTPQASAGEPGDTVTLEALTGELATVHKIEVGPISILDESGTGPKADRNYSCSFNIYLEEKTYLEIMRVSEANPDALEYIKGDLVREIRRWMLEVGGEALKAREMQGERGRKLRDHLNDRLPALRNRITRIDDFGFSARKH